MNPSVETHSGRHPREQVSTFAVELNVGERHVRGLQLQTPNGDPQLDITVSVRHQGRMVPALRIRSEKLPNGAMMLRTEALGAGIDPRTLDLFCVVG